MFHSLAIDPRDENVVYAGTEANGIFKTTDGGKTWMRLRKGLKCTAQHTGYSQIFDIAIDPKDSRTVYAAAVNGPGPAGNPIFPSASAGVYKSSDGGLSWVQKVTGFTNTYATYTLIDPGDSRRVYAAIGGVKSTFPPTRDVFFDGGLYVSDNAGESWRPLPLPAGVQTNIIIDMVIRGDTRPVLYASAQVHGNDAPSAYGLIKSDDGGATWKIINPAGITISGFDVSIQDPNLIYGHDTTPQRRVHKSMDGGNTWSIVPNVSFFGTIRIHPSNPQILFWTGFTTIMRSRDAMQSATTVYADPGLLNFQQMTDIEISPSNPNVVWASAKGYYLYRSTDGGDSFEKITAIRNMVYP